MEGTHVFTEGVVSNHISCIQADQHDLCSSPGSYLSFTHRTKLYRAEGDNTKEPIAEYHRPNHFFRKRKAMLKLQPEALEFLDSLISLCLFPS